MSVERPDIQPVSGGAGEPHRTPAEAASKPAKTPELVLPEGARPPPEGEPAEIEIVDIAKLEEEQRERRQAQNREAQRRWRQNHPEAHYRQVQKWKQKPENRVRAATYARAYRQRKKEELLERVDSTCVEE